MQLIDINTKAQSKLILEALQRGERITPMDAEKQFGSRRLGARIFDLRRRGFKIEKEMIPVPARTVSGTARVASYYMPVQDASNN